MSSFVNKSVVEAIRTIKYPFKAIVVGVFILLGITCLTNEVLGATIFEDSFENYDLGQLDGQGGWTLWSGTSYAEVVDTEVKEGIQSLELPRQADADNDYQIYKIGSTIPIGSIGWWYKIKNIGEGTLNHDLNIQVWADPYLQTIRVYYEADQEIRYYSNGVPLLLGNWVEDTWQRIDFEWNEIKQIRVNFNNEGWQDWVLNSSLTSNPKIATSISTEGSTIILMRPYVKRIIAVNALIRSD